MCDAAQAGSLFTPRVHLLLWFPKQSPSKAVNAGEKTGIDYIHTAASEQRQRLRIDFRKPCDARYKTLKAAPKDLCQDTGEKKPAEL